MAVVKDVFAPKPNTVANVAKKEAISEVQQAANEIDVVAATKKKAEDLAGLSGVAAERDQAVAEARQQREAREAEQQASLRGTIEDLGKKITETASGDKVQIKELQEEVKATNAELIKSLIGGLNAKIESLEKMRAEAAEPNDIAKQVKGIKAVFTELGLVNTQVSNAMPPEMNLQMKKMDFDMQQSTEDRADERARKDKEWQLQVRKWDEEIRNRREEFNMNIAVKREQTGMIQGMVQQVGEVIAKATVTKPGATSTGKKVQQNISKESNNNTPGPLNSEAIDITVEEGKAVVFDCANCKEEVVVAGDAESAICAGCETVYRVNRSPAAA